MPSSVKHGKDIIKRWFKSRSDITTVVDVGCGDGTYPRLLEGKYTWYGIEIWGPYIDQFELYSLYDHIIIGDFLWVDPVYLCDGDCTIFGDVLEHHAEGDLVLERLRDIIPDMKHTVISVPLSDEAPYEGIEHYGNPFEKHRSYYTHADISSLANWEIDKVINDIGIFIR
jgi:hypothetical protein